MQAIVRTAHGQVRGRARDGVAVFLGMPYAAAPFGANRFAAPQPVRPWDGVRDAFAFGATPPKPPYPKPIDELLPDPRVAGEECLNLNVWTPDPGGPGLPVMVWIHGGAFIAGAASEPVYDGAAFARDGVVLVTVEYRLGVEGFAQLPGAPGNRGLLDQIAALRWVQENIASFGGDPGNVTLFGQSAGGSSVATLLALDLARTDGLFHRAIAQSGAATLVHSAEDARLVTRELAARLGIEATRDAFAAVDPQRVIHAQEAAAAEAGLPPDPARWGRTTAATGTLITPVIDGELITRHPLDSLAAGAGADVDLLTGCTSEEMRLFLVPTGMAAKATETLAAHLLTGFGIDPALLTAYRDADPRLTLGDALCAVVTDGFYRLPVIRQAEQHAATSRRPTHLYEFAWRSPVADVGACHALELPFVFDTLGTGFPLAGPNLPQPLADTMHRAWVDFATHGDPGWPPFDPATRLVKVFDGADNRIATDPHGVTRRLWH
ncbi:carboxylesterase/lipase family protein [Kitasatospora sp. NPDC008050]|uniref:carboxylesterase/lipase family protein n=1 Tax=Kitasatospora sp. NPDC008050 TaxID=3364021 RepID=UPI0036EEDBD6